MRRAEVNGFRFHDLRHEAVSRLVEAGLGAQERHGVYGVLRELRRAGYLRFEQLREASGRVRGGVYLLTEFRIDFIRLRRTH